MVIYIDVLLVTNFIISYFLLIASAVLAGYTYKRKRIVFSAALGAFSCLYIFRAGENIALDFAVKFLSLALCSATAFGIKQFKKLAIQSAWFLLLNMLLTGLVTAVADNNAHIFNHNVFYYFDLNPVLLVISSAVIYIIIVLFSSIKETVSPPKTYIADICFPDFSLNNLSLFYDSGFKLKDIVSNKDVIIISYNKVKDCLPKKERESLAGFINENYHHVNYRFVPVFFNTLNGQGIAPAIKAKYMTIENKRIENLLVAFVENELSENVTGLFGNDIRKQL